MRVLRWALPVLALCLAGCADGVTTESAVKVGAVGRPAFAVVAAGSSGSIVSALSPTLCLGTNGGTAVVTNRCSGAANQNFTITAAGELQSGSMCLTAGAGQGVNGESLVLAACAGRASQVWKFTDASEIRGLQDRCVDIASGVNAANLTLIMWTCHNGQNQKWTLVVSAPPAIDTSALAPPTGPGAPVTIGGFVVGAATELPLMTQNTPAVCLDASTGVPLLVITCVDTSTQKFAYNAAGEVRRGSNCLSTVGGTGKDGEPATMAPCTGSASQKWMPTAAGELRGVGNRCLDVAGGNAQSGKPVIIWSCHNGPNQKWRNSTVASAPPTNVVAAVTVSAPTSTLIMGQSLQLTAVARTADGVVVSGRPVAWSSSNGGVATVSATGAVATVGVGSVSFTAVIDGKPGSVSLSVAGVTSGFFVSPSGSSTGNGSVDRPWSLAVALAHPSAVQPGDTIWLRGGTYRGNATSYLRGQAGRPIIVRQYPGERATIDGGLAVRGQFTWYWGFEVTNSDLGALITGVDVTGPGSKLINLIVHDAAGNGFGVWPGAIDAELYGNVLYNNGRSGSTAARYAHGIYFQNVDGTMRLVDNIVANTYAYGFHGYTENAALNNLYLEGNVAFNAGQFFTYGGAEFLVGGGQPVRNLTFTNNFSYNGAHYGARQEFGYGAVTPVGNRVTNNYFTGVTKLRYLDGLVFTGNTLVNAEREMLEIIVKPTQSLNSRYVFSNNTYRAPNANTIAAFRRIIESGTGFSFAEWNSMGFDVGSDFRVAPATDNRVFVRPNQYEKGRGHIIVYNWSRQASVLADLSAVLTPGDRYEIRDVQDYYGTPAASGTYGGGSVSVPMTQITAVPPLGAISFPATSTGVEFHTFVVVTR